jgi:hypothetical protein
VLFLAFFERKTLCWRTRRFFSAFQELLIYEKHKQLIALSNSIRWPLSSERCASDTDQRPKRYASTFDAEEEA